MRSRPVASTPLSEALENCRDFWFGYGGRRTTEDVFVSGVPESLFNGVRRIRSVDATEARVRIDGIRATLAGLPWTWWVGDDSPPHLASLLSSNGMTDVGALPILGAPIVELDSLSPPNDLGGLEIRVVPLSGLSDWVGMWAPASDLDSANVPAIVEAELRRDLSDGRLIRLEGVLEGEIVGSGMTYLSGSTAGIYAIATRDDHRRRGIGRMMTRAAIDAAFRGGATRVALQSTPIGLPLYRSMGFQELGAYRVFIP